MVNGVFKAEQIDALIGQLTRSAESLKKVARQIEWQLSKPRKVWCTRSKGT